MKVMDEWKEYMVKVGYDKEDTEDIGNVREFAKNEVITMHENGDASTDISKEMEEWAMENNKMKDSKEMVGMLLDVIWENVIGPDVIDNGDYNEMYYEDIEDGKIPTYDEFCDLRWDFREGNMSVMEAKEFIKRFL